MWQRRDISSEPKRRRRTQLIGTLSLSKTCHQQQQQQQQRQQYQQQQHQPSSGQTHPRQSKWRSKAAASQPFSEPNAFQTTTLDRRNVGPPKSRSTSTLSSPRGQLLMLLLVLLAANQLIVAIKLPTFLSSWRPTQASQQQVQSTVVGQDPLLMSASVFEPTEASRPKLAALAHQHSPLHLFRSFPRSLFGRFLPFSLPATTQATTTTTTHATTSETPLPMLFDWSSIGNEQTHPLMMGQSIPKQQQQPAFSNVYHFQATRPIQGDHFSIDHSNQIGGQTTEAQKHALGYGDSGEDFATIMTVEAQTTVSEQQQQPGALSETTQVRTNESSSSWTEGETNQSNSTNLPDDLLPQPGNELLNQHINSNSSSGGNSSLLTSLIGDELARLKEKPDELNSTQSSVGQPLLASLLDDQPNKSNSSGTTLVEQPPGDGANINGPESGRSESAAKAVTVVPPANGAAHEELEESESEAGDGREFSAGEHESAAADEQMESFILGPFKGLTSDSNDRVFGQQQVPASAQGMSAMASNLMQQAKSFIQMPFTNSMVHTTQAAVGQQQQLANQELPRIPGLFRGQQNNYLQQQQQQHSDRLIGQATSPVPFSFSPAMTNNHYHRQPQPLTYQGPPAWQQAPKFASNSMMMVPNHAIQHNNQLQQQQQQQPRPKNPFGFNRYFLMPSSTVTSTMGHLHHRQQNPYAQQQVSAKTVPYLAGQQPGHSSNYLASGQQRPQLAQSNDNSMGQATGFQLAIDHTNGRQQDNSIGLEQARKKFRSGLYQIEPPRLAGAQSTTNQSQQQQQQKIAALGDDEFQQTKQEEQEADSSEADPASDDTDNNEDEASEQLQQAGSGNGNPSEQAQQQPKAVAEFAAKQVGASIGFSTNSSSDPIHKGKVFNEPISDLLKSQNRTSAKGDKTNTEGGQNLSSTKQLRHSEEVTLYEFESPSQQPQHQQHQAVAALARPREEPAHRQQLLDTQVFTVPYTITMQPNGQVSHFAAPPARMRAPNSNHNNFIHHREPPFAHSFISNTWTHPLVQGYFPPASQRPQLQYLAPPVAEAAKQNQQLFKSVFQEAQQLATASPQLTQQAPQWSQTPLRPVSALAVLPQQQHHYFNYQPLQQQQPNLAHDRRLSQPSQQQQQVIYELANQPRRAQAQQFALAIDHSANQNGGGSSLFTSNQQTLEEFPGKPESASTTTTTSTTTQLPPTTATAETPTTTNAAPESQTRPQRVETTSFPPTRESDDGDDKLANLRGNPPNQQQQQPAQSGASSPAAFCADRAPGLYADESQKCKAYYQCAPTGHQMFRCNNQTQFNQKTQNCDWWYNVNCSGQGVASDAEQLPQSEPLLRQVPTDGENNQPGPMRANESPSSATPSSESDDSPAQQQQTTPVAPHVDSGERYHHADTSDTSTVGSFDQSTVVASEQQPAPTSSTPTYASLGAEFSARSTTTLDPLTTLPSTTAPSATTTTQAFTTSTGISAGLATGSDLSGGQSGEVKPQVGAQLSELHEQVAADAIAFSSSTSVSSGGSDEDGPTEAAPDEQPTTVGAATDDNRLAAPKLAARSLLPGRVSASKRRPTESTIYSTSANQGSVSYTPMHTHQLTARAFQPSGADQSGGGGDTTNQHLAHRRPIEKRFGARLQTSQQATTTTTATPASRGQQTGVGARST